MNPAQLTLDIDALEQCQQSKYIKDDLLSGSMQLQWAHFYADSEHERNANAEAVIQSEVLKADIIRIPDFDGHFMNTSMLLNALQSAIFNKNQTEKIIVSSSYMPFEAFLQYVFDNLDGDTNTKLNIAAILNHAMGY